MQKNRLKLVAAPPCTPAYVVLAKAFSPLIRRMLDRSKDTEKHKLKQNAKSYK